MDTHSISATDPQAVERAYDLLQRGGLVAFPTDTVYGLAASAYHPAAIEQLYFVKGRGADKAIAILIGDPTTLAQVAADISPDAARLAVCFWPGPLTLVVARHPDLPSILSPLPTIGVRMPDHPIALEILRRAGPLAVTSANLSGHPNTTTAQEVAAQLGGLIPLILDGGVTPGGQPSTVLDCTGPELVILRSGPLSLPTLQSVLG